MSNLMHLFFYLFTCIYLFRVRKYFFLKNAVVFTFCLNRLFINWATKPNKIKGNSYTSG